MVSQVISAVRGLALRSRTLPRASHIRYNGAFTESCLNGLTRRTSSTAIHLITAMIQRCA
jgi:hypothetical protein